jgi:hypothetical protein
MPREAIHELADRWNEELKRPGWRDIFVASGIEIRDVRPSTPSPAFIARARARCR